MENQDNNIKNDNKINYDSQLSEENNKQQNKNFKWVNKKNITIILTLLVVIIAGIFLFIRSSNAYGAKTPEEVSQKFLDAIEKEDYLKNLKDGIENFRDELFPTIQSSNPWLKKDISSNENLKNLIFCKNIVEFLADDIKKDYPNAIEIARDTTEKEILQLGMKRKGLER